MTQIDDKTANNGSLTLNNVNNTDTTAAGAEGEESHDKA
jgi:hypothetical protein